MGSLLPGKNWARRDIWDTTSSMLGRTLIALSQHFVIRVSTTGGQPCSRALYKIVKYFLCL